jgi:hypothetical protein
MRGALPVHNRSARRWKRVVQRPRALRDVCREAPCIAWQCSHVFSFLERFATRILAAGTRVTSRAVHRGKVDRVTGPSTSDVAFTLLVLQELPEGTRQLRPPRYDSR